MIVDGAHAWTVNFDIPEKTIGGHRTYTAHRNATVMTSSVTSAIALVTAHFPDAKVWGVSHASNRSVIIVDDALIPEVST